MLIHQICNSMGDTFNARVYNNALWTTHFHKAFEFICVLRGETHATVNQKPYTLREGDCLLIPPFAAHSFEVRSGNVCLVVVFSSHYAESANDAFQSGAPQDFFMRLSEAESDYVSRALIGNTDLSADSMVPLKKPPILRLKACLYMILDAFIRQNPFQKRALDGMLTEQMTAYMEQHYAEDITLLSMSQDLGYSYDYISRVFHQAFHMNFKTIVNQYRCEHAMHLLSTTQKPFTEISMDSGFQSIRSFNRVFLSTVGVTPSDFRRKAEHN